MKSCLKLNGTMVANEFIDKYMAGANGEYVKVYLYILRHEGQIRDVGQIADALDHTESDVKRAVGYWARLGVLEEQGSVNGQAEIKSGNYSDAEGDVLASGFGGAMEQGRESGNPGRAEAPGNAGRFNPGVPGGAAGGFNRPEASESSRGNALNGFEKAGGKGAGAKSGAAGGSDVPVPERREAAFPKGGGEPSSSPRKLYTPEQVSRLADQEDFTQLLYISQKYMNKVPTFMTRSICLWSFWSIWWSTVSKTDIPASGIWSRLPLTGMRRGFGPWRRPKDIRPHFPRRDLR